MPDPFRITVARTPVLSEAEYGAFAARFECPTHVADTSYVPGARFSKTHRTVFTSDATPAA